MAWPTDPIDLAVELFMGGAWVDAVTTGNGVRERSEVTINYGRPDWAAGVDPARCTWTLDNRDGRWSPDYSTGAHFGSYRRNIPCRVGIGRGEIHLARTEVSADLASTPDIAGIGGGSPTAPAHSSTVESEETAYTTSHDVLMPATLAATDRIVISGHIGHQTFTPDTELTDAATQNVAWTLAWSDNIYTPWAGHFIWISDPLDAAAATALAAATLTWTTTQAVRSSWQATRVTASRSGGEGTAWEIATTSSKTFDAAPTPPAVTTTWGADEHLALALMFFGSAGATVTSSPFITGFTDIAQGHVTSLVQIASAWDTFSTATITPGAATLSASENWHAATVVFRAVEDTSADGVLDISGDIDLRIEFELEEDLVDIAEGGTRARLAKKSSGANGWFLQMYYALDNVVAWLAWYDSSGLLQGETTEATGAALPRDLLHEHRALRVTLDVDNGASGHVVTWYTSTDIDGTWTQLGSPITTAGTTSIKTNDARIDVGGSPTENPNNNVQPFPGRIYAFDMYDGIGGTVVANPRFNARTVGDTSWADSAGRTWTIGTGGRITNMLWRFHGELSSLPVRWNIDGSDVTAPVEAAGLFRRLRQGRRRLNSAIRRAIIRDAVNLIQYWPLEEEGSNVSSFGAAAGDAPFLVSNGFPTAATNTDFLASNSLPTPGDSVWTATVDDYSALGTEAWQIRWLQSVPSTFTGSGLHFMRVETSDMVWEVSYRDTSGGQLQLHAYRGLTEVYSSGWVGFNATGTAWRMTMAVVQNGGNVNAGLEAQDADESAAGGFFTTDAVAGSAGQVARIIVNKDSDVKSWAFGHVTLQNTKTTSSELATELNAHDGEKAGDRIMRLLREEGIGHRIEGNPADTEAMGPQRPGTLMDLLEECARTDLGILHESRETVAVAYRTRASMLDQDQKELRDETNLAAWWTTADVTATDQQTIVDRSGVTGVATLGATSGADGTDPTVTLGSPTRLDPDGTDDYVQIPYTPTVTDTTGALTVVLAGYWNDTATADGRLFSFESAAANGIWADTNSAASGFPVMTMGDGTSEVGATMPGSALGADERFLIALVVDNGAIRAYRRGETAFSSDSDTTTLGTVAMGSGILLARADTVTANVASSSVTDCVILERALTLAELDELADWVWHRHQTGLINLDYTAGEVAGSPQLDRDDQGFANDIEVRNRSGATARAVLDDGSALSVSEPPVGAGRYDDTFQVNGQDTRLVALAETRLALSAVDEPRVSRLALALHHTALVADTALTSAIFDASLGDLVTVVNVLDKAIGDTQIRQILQGTRERIGIKSHTIDMLTTPASPWTGGVTGGVAAPPGVHSVEFRSQNTLATSGTPVYVLEALGYTGPYPITRAQLDDILDDWVASTGGTTRTVDNSTEMATALGAAVPGDLIRQTTTYAPTGGKEDIRGNRYGISGQTLTTSPAGGQPGLPIIVTSADGVYFDPNNTSSGEPVIDLRNCQHVWAVGVNVRDGQFGIRAQNWGGSEGFPAYIAHPGVENCGHAGITVQGWWQAIATSGGTPPAGTGNEWGYSNHFVIEEYDVDGVGVINDSTGEGVYLGYGASPGWVSYCEDGWIRGGRITDFTSDGIDVKPGCHRIYITDPEIHTGHAESGAPLSLLYVAAAIDDRDGTLFDRDPELWLEGYRVHDIDLTNVDASSVHIIGYVGLSGIRIAHGISWAHPQTGTHATWRFRNEKGANDTEALAEFRADPTWIINTTSWGDDTWENGGYGASPTAFPTSVTDAWDFLNNICDQASPATGEVDAAASDFVATVPAIGVDGDAEWDSQGKGSAFDLDPDSALVGAGASITAFTFYIEADISQRALDKTTPNPGAFHQHPANT